MHPGWGGLLLQGSAQRCQLGKGSGEGGAVPLGHDVAREQRELVAGRVRLEPGDSTSLAARRVCSEIGESLAHLECEVGRRAAGFVGSRQPRRTQGAQPICRPASLEEHLLAGLVEITAGVGAQLSRS